MATNSLTFNRMIRRAKDGDENAIKQLKSYLKTQGSYANKQLKALEEAGETDYAYSIAMEYLEDFEGVQRFRTTTAGFNVEELTTRAETIHRFLKSPTHTVIGAQSAWASQEKGLMKLRDVLGYSNVTTDRETIKRISKLFTNKNLKRAAGVLGTDGLKLTQGEKYNLIDAFSAVINAKPEVTDKELELVLLRYLSGDLHYNEIVTSALEDMKRG